MAHVTHLTFNQPHNMHSINGSYYPPQKRLRRGDKTTHESYTKGH